nr:diacylglycerol kinase kappa-like [Pelodiscus sinensis]|eukprot:XP_014427907.1 diacylglycerol kinase kappa-like [Pelodiscus sinensis]
MQPGCPDTAEQQGASLALAPCLPSPAAVDEQNKQTQAYRSKKDSLEELGKAPEPLASRRGTVISPTSSIFLDRPDSFSAAHFAEDPNTIQFSERCVMNNYFGIGLDAKISLEFNNKRDEHPKKCR